MNQLVWDFYKKAEKENERFSDVLFLVDEKLSFDEVQNICSECSRGWYELCKLTVSDRLEFIQEFWLKTLPFHPKFPKSLQDFFSNVDDIGVFLIKKEADEKYQPELVYSLKENASFFRGLPSSNEKAIQRLMAEFDQLLPNDYIAFFRIHNGFAKTYDTGLIKLENMKEFYDQFCGFMKDQEKTIFCDGKTVDPELLIPFFENFGLHSYQCFHKDWYPSSQMGTVYYSGIEGVISDYSNRKEDAESLAFETYLDWLAYYLKGMKT